MFFSSFTFCFADCIRILEHFGLSVFFDYIGGASFDRSRESKVEVMRYLCQLANITDMDSAIMVGDRKFDVSGAHAIGMEFMLTGWFLQ